MPGDFVSYHARASDAVSHSDTDIFFLEVQPYDREYYQSQTGGIGLPGGGSQELELSKRQKQIIIATFKLQKDRTLDARPRSSRNRARPRPWCSRDSGKRSR